MVQQEKFAAAGKIANIISHEIRNPLGAITNALYFLHMKIPATDEKITKNLDIIQASVDHARQIVSDLLEFTRIKQPNFVSCDIPDFINDVIEKAAIPDSVSVQRRFEANFSAVIDPGLLRQALLNLVTNAIQAMPEGGTLEIDTLTEGDTFRIDVRDTGTGIPDDVKLRLFEVLFTTKVHGIGLGLPLVKEIVAKHSGTVSFESEMGTGQCFTIQLPLQQAALERERLEDRVCSGQFVRTYRFLLSLMYTTAGTLSRMVMSRRSLCCRALSVLSSSVVLCLILSSSSNIHGLDLVEQQLVTYWDCTTQNRSCPPRSQMAIL